MPEYLIFHFHFLFPRRRELLNHLNSKHSIALTFFARNSVFFSIGYRSILKYCYFSRESGNQMQPDCSDNTFLDVCHCFYKRLVADLGLKEGGCLKGREGGATYCRRVSIFDSFYRWCNSAQPSLLSPPPPSSRPSIYLSGKREEVGVEQGIRNFCELIKTKSKYWRRNINCLLQRTLLLLRFAFAPPSFHPRSRASRMRE